jgi:non-ribosomal peptide synthetase component F
MMGMYLQLYCWWYLKFDSTKMFNTGDLVRWLDDGNLEHQGRGDDQVKIKVCWTQKLFRHYH